MRGWLSWQYHIGACQKCQETSMCEAIISQSGRSQWLCARCCTKVSPGPIVVSTTSHVETPYDFHQCHLISRRHIAQDQCKFAQCQATNAALYELEKENFALRYEKDVLLDRVEQLSLKVQDLEYKLNCAAMHSRLAVQWSEGRHPQTSQTSQAQPGGPPAC